MQKNLKQRILDYVESLKNDASYSQIVRFAHDCKHGADAWDKNPNRRGWFSNAFTGQWVYEKPKSLHQSHQVGYLVKRGVKTGWLEKKSNRRYKTVRKAS